MSLDIKERILKRLRKQNLPHAYRKQSLLLRKENLHIRKEVSLLPFAKINFIKIKCVVQHYTCLILYPCDVIKKRQLASS